MNDDPRIEALRSIFRDGVVHRIGEENSEKAARHNAMAFVVNNSPMIFAAPDMLEALEAWNSALFADEIDACFGPRCPTFDADCTTCKLWHVHDLTQ